MTSVKPPIASSKSANSIRKNLGPKTTDYGVAHQLFLALSDGNPQGLPEGITSAPRDIGLRKNNELIQVDKLPLVAGRFIDTAFFIASHGSAEKGTFSVDIEFFCWLMNYRSRNYAALRAAIKEAQSGAIVVITPDGQYGSFKLVGDVTLVRGRIYFDMSSYVLRALREPEQWTYLSFRCSAAFTSQYARTLWARLRQEKFRGMIEYSLEEFRCALGINDLTAAKTFKYIQRVVLGPAIEQINRFSDIKVTLNTMSRGPGRTITHLQFLIEDNPDGQFAGTGTLGHEYTDVIQIMRSEFLLSSADIDEIMNDPAKYSVEYLFRSIEFTRLRQKQQHGKENQIRYPGLYLKKAIKDNLHISQDDVSQTLRTPSSHGSGTPVTMVAERLDSESRALQREASESLESARKELDAIPPDAGLRMAASFSRSMTGKSLMKIAGIGNGSVAPEELLGNPKIAAAFAQFVLNNSKPATQANASQNALFEQ